MLVGAVGINSSSLKLFKDLVCGYTPPQTTKTFICEFFLGHEKIVEYFGDSMHVFLLDIPRLEFAALIPKGDYVTMTLLGKEIDKDLVQSLLNTPEVKQRFPVDWNLVENNPCKCFPKINTKSAVKPFADRVVLIGDCSTTKLYKNGIGAAYYTAKAAATTATFEGISNEDFSRYYWPTCKAIIRDNNIARVVFTVTRIIQKVRFIRRGVIRMTFKEQKKGYCPRMSMVLWDTFTGSASYREIFLRSIYPMFLIHLLWETAIGLLPFKITGKEESKKTKQALWAGCIKKVK